MFLPIVMILSTAILVTPCNIADAVPPEENSISLDTKDADIRDILLGLAQSNGINLILDDSIQGRVTISLSDISPLDAIGLILHTNGYTVGRSGDSIVAATPDELRRILPPVSKIIALKYASATELEGSLSQIASEQTTIKADARTNSLIITGTTSGIRAIEQAVELLDMQVEQKTTSSPVIKTIPLKHAQASSIKPLIEKLCSPAGKIEVDSRTNSVIISENMGSIAELVNLIKELDVPAPTLDDGENERQTELFTRIYRLNHIDANVLEKTLQGILSPSGSIQSVLRQKVSITPVKPGDDREGNMRQDTNKSVEEKWSDILIITDTADIIAKIDDLIEDLDTRTPQVLIEAKMVELNLDEDTDIGIDWHSKHSPSKTLLGVNLGGGESDNGEGMNIQIGTLSTQHFEDIMLKIRALEMDGQAKLISNPSVISLDNELAQMIVADKIPIPTTYETEFSASTSYKFINVGIMLTVIPHITDDGYIIMDAMPEVNSIKDWTRGENPQPIISSRMAHARVRVQDGQTFAIGGLIRNEQREAESRVPVLSSIPFLGRLFRARKTDNSKTDLVVFITSRVCQEDSAGK